MFDFDHWADRLRAHADEQSAQGLHCLFTDGRLAPELSNNPSFSLELAENDRIGAISFWSNGLCDYHVLDVATAEEIASAAMLEATDRTVIALFERFRSEFHS